MKPYLLIIFLGLTLKISAQAPLPVYFFNEGSFQAISQKIQSPKGVLVSIRDGGYYTYQKSLDNRKLLANYLEIDSFVYVDFDRKIDVNLSAVECNYVISKRFDKRLALLELIIPVGKKGDVSSKEAIRKVSSTLDMLNGHASYFILLMKVDSENKRREIMPLLMKDLRIHTIIVLSKPGDYVDKLTQIITFPADSDELVKVEL